jgi:hypothetical protein
VIAMVNDEQLKRIKEMIEQAKFLAADESVFLRVAGERISVILADVLYEVDPSVPEVISLLPQQRR